MMCDAMADSIRRAIGLRARLGLYLGESREEVRRAVMSMAVSSSGDRDDPVLAESFVAAYAGHFDSAYEDGVREPLAVESSCGQGPEAALAVLKFYVAVGIEMGTPRETLRGQVAAFVGRLAEFCLGHFDEAYEACIARKPFF